VTRPGTTSSTTSGGTVPNKGDLLSRVSVGRISEVIVDQIRLLIRSGQLTAGDRLPSERELCERFGVSRVTVREALRVLEANGLVDIRVGARGGAFVTAPSSRMVGDALADLISLSSLSALEVTEAHMVFELGLVPLVCERATEEDIAALYELCDRGSAAIASGDDPVTLSTEWHSRFARSSHNRAITLLAESLHDPGHDDTGHGHPGVEEHRALVDAVAARDVERATELMRAHLAGPDLPAKERSHPDHGAR
jgi:DNA-binding FadR family transcriptional regulator